MEHPWPIIGVLVCVVSIGVGCLIAAGQEHYKTPWIPKFYAVLGAALIAVACAISWLKI